MQAKHLTPTGHCKKCEKIIQKEDIRKEGVFVSKRGGKKSKPEQLWLTVLSFDESRSIMVKGLEGVHSEKKVKISDPDALRKLKYAEIARLAYTSRNKKRMQILLPIGSERVKEMIDKINTKAYGIVRKRCPELKPESTKIDDGAKMGVRRIFECWFSDHTTNGHQFTMSNRHQELASPEANGFCKELASPKQTALGKDISNPLIVGSLLKTIWLSVHHVIAMKHWLFQSKRLLQEEINDRMTEMFKLLKELTTSRAPEKVLIKEEGRHPVTKNVNSISLIREEEEKNANDKATSSDSIKRPNGSDAEVPINEVEKENEAKNGIKNKPIKSAEKELTQVKEEESMEALSS
ncbi:hypothetical protein Tco_1334815 [Tanacetum coccineum]